MYRYIHGYTCPVRYDSKCTCIDKMCVIRTGLQSLEIDWRQAFKLCTEAGGDFSVLHVESSGVVIPFPYKRFACKCVSHYDSMLHPTFPWVDVWHMMSLCNRALWHSQACSCVIFSFSSWHSQAYSCVVFSFFHMQTLPGEMWFSIAHQNWTNSSSYATKCFQSTHCKGSA